MSAQPIEVSVSSGFSDGRIVTFTCLSYHPTHVEVLTLKSGIQPHETWTNQQYDEGTMQKCHMVWRRHDGELTRSMFEVFVGAHNHDHSISKNPNTQEIQYFWLVTEAGLLLHSFASNSYHVVKPLWLIQYIGVVVENFLNQRIIILCISHDPSGHSEVVAIDSSSYKEGVTWTIRDFNSKTIQRCRVDFADGARFEFEAFNGSWKHDDSIWDVNTERPIYRWILRANSLRLYNYLTNTEMLINNFG